MALAAFALCLVGALLWVLALALLVPRLLAAALAAAASRALRGRAHLSARALRVYPLAGTVVLRGVVVAVPDAAVDIRELVLACRWWRPWTGNTPQASPLSSSSTSSTTTTTTTTTTTKTTTTTTEAAAAHAPHEADDASTTAAATAAADQSWPPPGGGPAFSEEFPAVFALTLEGLRVRVVNNTAAYDHLEELLRACAAETSVSHQQKQNCATDASPLAHNFDPPAETSVAAEANMASESLPMHDRMASDHGPPGPKTPPAHSTIAIHPAADRRRREFNPVTSLSVWLKNHTSLRILTCSVYVHNHAHASFVQVVTDVAKFRYCAIPAANSTRHSAAFSMAKLRVSVSAGSQGTIAEQAAGAANPICACFRRPRGPSCCATAARCSRRGREPHSPGPLPLVEVLAANGVAGEYIADERTGYASTGGDQMLLNQAVVNMQGMHLTCDQASSSAFQDILERIFPPLYLMNELAEKRRGLGGKSASVPLTLHVRASPKTMSEALLTVPFLPRESTWHRLRLLGVRNWQDGPSSAPENLHIPPPGTGSANAENSPPLPQLPMSGNLKVYGETLIGTISFPSSRDKNALFLVKVSVSSAKVMSKGVFEAPFVRATSLQVSYEEKVQEEWNSPRRGSLHITFERSSILYLPDHVRMFDDITHAAAAHGRFAESVRFFVPFTLDLSVVVCGGYVIRACVSRGSSWSDLSVALDDRSVPVAELRGDRASFAFFSHAGLEFSPLVSSAKWQLDIPDSELFLVLPIGGPHNDRCSARDDCRDSQRTSGDTTSRRHWLKRRSTQASLRNLNQSSQIDNQPAIRSSGKVDASSIQPLTLPSHREHGVSSHMMRIARLEGQFSISGDTVVLFVTLPHAVDSADIRIEANSVSVDINPYHLRYVFALVENIVGHCNHSLSEHERENLLKSRQIIGETVLESRRSPSILEAFRLGLDPGRLAGAKSSAAYEETSSFEMNICAVTIRLHDLPTALCPFSSTLTNSIALALGPITCSAFSSFLGSTVHISSHLNKDATLAPGVSFCKCENRAEVGQSDEATTCLSGWQVWKRVFLDANGSPYYSQTDIELGTIVGSLPFSTALALSRICLNARLAFRGENNPIIDALWNLQVSRISAERIDVLVPLCDPGVLDFAPGFCHLLLDAGFRTCLNNLARKDGVGRSALVISRISVFFYSLLNLSSGGRWIGEIQIRKAIQTGESICRVAAKVSPLSVAFLYGDSPRLWSADMGHLQGDRLRMVDSTLNRLPAALWNRGPAMSILSPTNELYQAEWWHFSLVGNVQDRAEGTLPHAACSTRIFLTNIEIEVRPEFFEVLHQSLLYWKVASFTQHGSLADPQLKDSVWNEESTPEMAYIDLWRNFPRNALVLNQSSNNETVNSRFEVSCVTVRITVRSAVSCLLGDRLLHLSESRRADAQFFAREHVDDVAHVDLPLGIHFGQTSTSGASKVPSLEILLFHTLIGTLPICCISLLGRELVRVEESTLKTQLVAEDHPIGSDLHESEDVNRIGSQSCLAITLSAIFIGKGIDDLASYNMLGRLVSVYGLMVRAILADYEAAALIQVKNQQGLCESLFGIEDLELLRLGNPDIVAYEICSAMYRSKNVHTTNEYSVSTAECLKAHPICYLSHSEYDGSKSAPRVKVLDPSHGSTFSFNFLREDNVTHDGKNAGPLIAKHQLKLCAQLLDFRIITGLISVLGYPVFRVGDLSCKGRKDTKQQLFILAIGSASFSVLDIAVAGILNVVTAVASHTTKASKFLPILIYQGHDIEGRSFQVDELSHDGICPGNFDITASIRSSSSPDHKSRPLHAIRAFRQFRYRSSVSAYDRELASSDLKSSKSGTENGCFVLRGTGLPVSIQSDLGCPLASPQNYNTGTHARKVEVGTFVRAAGLSAGNENNTRNGPNPKVEGRAMSSEFGNRSLTVLIALGPMTLSYKHTLLRSDAAGRSVREPDFRLVFNNSSASVLFGPARSFYSVLVHSGAISLMSRNEYDCDFRGSLSTLRACGSLSPAEGTPGLPMLRISTALSGIDLSLEAADLYSVVLFRNQFKEDLKGIGESLFNAGASVRAMMQSTRLARADMVSCTELRLRNIEADIFVQNICFSLLGFHPGDKAMRISHDSSSMFANAMVSEEVLPNLILGGRIHGHSLAVSASRWYAEERLNFPSLDVCGVHWGDKSGRPTQVQLVAGPVWNIISSQGIRNMIFVMAGLMAFQTHAPKLFDVPPGDRAPENQIMSGLYCLSSRSVSGAITDCVDNESEKSILQSVLAAWERTKSVRMEMKTMPMSIALASGIVIASFEIGELFGIVEWNKLVTRGVQLNLAIIVPVLSFAYGRQACNREYANDQSRDDSSLSIEFKGGRVDVLKCQDGKLHKFVMRLRLDIIESCVQPFQFMEDAAIWADEQEIIRDIQVIQLDVSSSNRIKSSLPSAVTDGSDQEHRLYEVGLEVGSALLRVPLLMEDNRSSSRLAVTCSDICLLARLGDEMALPSQCNLAKARLRSLNVLWDELDLFCATETELMFAVRGRPEQTGALLRSLRGSVALETWVIYPRHDIVLAIVDARISKQFQSSKQAAAKLGSIPERLTRASSTNTSSHEPSPAWETRMLFESVELFIKPSPGFIDGLDGRPSSIPSRDMYRPPRDEVPTASGTARMKMPIPVFSVAFIRSPRHVFDVMDIDFSRKTQDEFPDGCLAKVAGLFSDLYGAVASRVSVSAGTSVFPACHADIADLTPSKTVPTELSCRNWSALLRFGESRYVAREDAYNLLKTRFSFAAGHGSGVLASVFSSGGIHELSGEATVVSGVSPMFKLEIQPQLENTKPQCLTLQHVKIVQCYARAVPPHFAVHVGEVKADMDVVTLLLSREYITRSTSTEPITAEEDPNAVQIVAPQSSNHAALALAAAAPAESKLILVLGQALVTPDQNAIHSHVPKSNALLCRLYLSQPDGKVGLKVNRVHLEYSRKSALSSGQTFLSTDMHVAIHQVSSFAEWEHLSANWGFHSLRIRVDCPLTLSDGHPSGLALIAHKIEFKCKRDDCDALKFEVDGAAAAIRFGGNINEFQTSLQSTNVDAYISSSTGKTIKRLRQLYSRLARGLRPQVEKLAISDGHRDSSRYRASRDNLGSGASLGLQNQRHDSKSRTSHGLSAAIPTSPSLSCLPGRSMPPFTQASDAPVHQSNLTKAEKGNLVGHIVISGDRLIVTMHGFSFDDNQPQAKLLFNAYDLHYTQRLAADGDFGFIVSTTRAQECRRFSLRYNLLDVKYSDQRQNSVTVMSLPDPHLLLTVVEGPTDLVRVEFTTHFAAAVDISPSVSHYDYIRQLMSLYRNVSIGSLASTLTELDGKVVATKDTDTDLSSANLRTNKILPLRDFQELISNHSERQISEQGFQTAHSKSARWGGREVSFGRLVFAPRLRPLGDLTPDVSVVLGWLGVGGIEALPAGLYDSAIVPCSYWLELLYNLRCRR